MRVFLVFRRSGDGLSLIVSRSGDMFSLGMHKVKQMNPRLIQPLTNMSSPISNNVCLAQCMSLRMAKEMRLLHATVELQLRWSHHNAGRDSKRAHSKAT